MHDVMISCQCSVKLYNRIYTLPYCTLYVRKTVINHGGVMDKCTFIFAIRVLFIQINLRKYCDTDVISKVHYL
jgi:hypothetical protein